MILAIIVIFVVSVLATALFVYSSNDFLQYNLNKDYKKAQYLARTGVEATIKAWQSVTSNILVPRETLPVYLMDDGTFETPDIGDDPSEDAVGYYTVKVNPNGEKEVEGNTIRVIYFDSTAVVGDSQATASAYTVMSLDAYQQGWYNSNGVPSETGMKTLDSSVVNSSLLFGTSSSSIKGHVFPGNITFPQPDPSNPKTFKLNNNSYAYAGKALYFNMPIQLKNGTNNKNILVLSGGDIVLNEDVELYAYYGFANAGVGTLVLSVLEDYEHDDPLNTSTSNGYGKVYLNGDVYVTISTSLTSNRTKIFSKGDVYYFKAREGETTKALDLLKYYIDNNGSGSFIADLFSSLYPSGMSYAESDMRKIDPANNTVDLPSDLIPPHPDEDGTVIWQ